MRVINDPKYSKVFPETYCWNMIDSMKYSYLADIICGEIRYDIATDERLLVPGLRKALNLLAEKAFIL